jgi:hypothetical protein
MFRLNWVGEKAMNPSQRLSVPSLFQGALAFALAACSNTTNEVQPMNDAAGAGDVGATTGDGGIINGSGSPCPVQTQVTMALKLTLNSTWPVTTAVQMGTGTVSVWLLSNYGIDSQNKLAGRVRTCGNQTPPITLTSLGAASVGAPGGATAQVQITIPPSVWNAPSMPTSAVTGTLGGWNIGSSFTVDPVVTLSGLKPTSQLANASTAWPPSVTTGPAVPAGDITDDDGDGKPGITATPRSDMGFYVPRTSLAPSSPQTDKLYVVLRTALSLYGTSTSCADGTGTATVTNLDNHVIGCHIPDPEGGAGTDCDNVAYDFIDSNTTAYQVTSGTYVSKQLQMGTGDGGSVTCDDVLKALP